MRTSGLNRTILIWFGLIAAGFAAAGAQAPAAGEGRDLEQRVAALEARIAAMQSNDVRAFGAVGDGAHDDTAAIQKAIDTLHASGGGTLFIPAGKFRITGGGLKLRNNVSFCGVDRISSQLIFAQQDPTQYLINVVNDASEYAPADGQIRNLRLVTSGGGALRDQPTRWKDGIARGWHHAGMSNVTIEGGSRGGYAVDLPHYNQELVLENVTFVDFYGPFLRIDGNFNVLRNVSASGWCAARSFRNANALPMISIAGDSNVLEDSVIEAFSGFPALQLTGHRHRVLHIWAESDGKVPDNAWIVLNDAHHILFDWPHVLVEGTHKLKMINSDATALMLETKHLQHSLDLDNASSLTVLVPARSMSPGVHVVAHAEGSAR